MQVAECTDFLGLLQTCVQSLENEKHFSHVRCNCWKDKSMIEQTHMIHGHDVLFLHTQCFTLHMRY